MPPTLYRAFRRAWPPVALLVAGVGLLAKALEWIAK